MDVDAVTVIDVAMPEGSSALFSVVDAVLGKLSPDPVEVRMQDDLRAAATEAALKRGFRNLSEFMRFCVARETYGDDGLRSMADKKFRRHGLEWAAPDQQASPNEGNPSPGVAAGTPPESTR